LLFQVAALARFARGRLVSRGGYGAVQMLSTQA